MAIPTTLLLQTLPLHQLALAFVATTTTGSHHQHTTTLGATIGLGPDPNETKELARKDKLVAGVDYEIPDHEAHRLDRRTKIDERCDEWFASLLRAPAGCLGDTLCQQARKRLETLPVLRNEFEKDTEDPEWTPYVSTALPWSILRPAYGLEAFGLPIPRRSAETWRHFDVPNMVAGEMDGSLLPDTTAVPDTLGQELGDLLVPDEACAARLVYWNGVYVPGLSKERKGVRNWESMDDDVAKEGPAEMETLLGRLTDGWSDELMAPVDVMYGPPLTSYKKLSGPHHNIGDPDLQWAVNSQQGTACFAALNTWATRSVAMVHVDEDSDVPTNEDGEPLPIVITHVRTGDGGIENSKDTAIGAAQHPRTVVVAESGSSATIVQQSISLQDDSETARPVLVNGYTQMLVKENATIKHSFVEESGGMPVGGVEARDDDLRTKEASRKASANTVLEVLDVHCAGDLSTYNGTIVSMGANGRTRLASSISLLRPSSSCLLRGFSLSGGNCRTDIKTNIHHIADGCTSEQLQKNMISGRATTSFRGRVRVEQAAQQTDSQQLSRTALLTDTCRAWAVPSLEIIADDVKCTHGATVSDLSSEELFYLQSRGLNVLQAREILMLGFGNEAVVDLPDSMAPGILGRLRERIKNLAPRAERAVEGEYQSV